MTDDLGQRTVAVRRLTGRGPVRTGTAPATLVLLHHAAGSADSFRPLLRHLPADWTILAPELPARVGARGEVGVGGVTAAVRPLAEDLLDRITGPFAMFGHCLGAILGHELAHELVGHGKPPAWLGVSGSPPPHAATENLRRMVTEWSQAGLIQLARALGGMPEQVWANEALAERILRTFRADLSIIAGYRFPVRPPLPMPVSVFGGEADPYVDGTQIRAWNGTGTGPATVHMWPGGHFYLYDHAAEVCAYLVDDAVAAVERSR